MARTRLAGLVNMHEDGYRHLTLNHFSTNSKRLRAFSRKNKIKPGEHVILVGRSGRVRVFKVEEDGTHKVELCEYDTQKISVEVAVYQHFLKQATGVTKELLEELKEDAEIRRMRREARRRAVAAETRRLQKDR